MADEPKTPEEPISAPPSEPDVVAQPEASAADGPWRSSPETPAAAPVEPAAPQAAGRPVLTAVVTTVALFAVLGGATALTAPFWKPYVDRHVGAIVAADPRLADAKAAVAEIAALHTMVAALTADSARRDQDLAALREQLDRALAQAREGAANATKPLSAEPALVEELNRRLGRLEATLDADRAAAKESLARANEDQSRLAATIQGFRGTVSGVEDALKKQKAADTRSRLLVVALAQLSAALASAEPFEPLLGALKAVAGDDPALAAVTETIRPYGRTGIPTLAVLRERFEGAARQAVRAQAAPQGEGWFDKTLGRLAGLVSVRTIGDQAEPRNPVDAALATGDRMLKEGNLQGAADALARIEGPPAVEVAGWLKDARARLAAQQAIARLNERSMSALAEAGG